MAVGAALWHWRGGGKPPWWPFAAAPVLPLEWQVSRDDVPDKPEPLHLDAALGDLDESDRDAVMLRYFEKKSAREIAAQLGISDDAALKNASEKFSLF